MPARVAVTVVILASLGPWASVRGEDIPLCDNQVWVVVARPVDPLGRVPEAPMQVVLNGVTRGEAQVVVFHHRVAGAASWPEVCAFFSSGFVRCKPARVPDMAFGASFVLGPGYWRDGRLFNNPQLERFEIDAPLCDRVGADGPVALRITGHTVSAGVRGDLDVEYFATLHAPTAHQITLDVTQRATARRDFQVDADRVEKREGVKLVRVSSMFIAGTCHDPRTGRTYPAGGCHDVDAIRWPEAAGEVATLALAARSPPAQLFEPAAAPQPAGRWIDVVHADTAGWQGATPSLRVLLADAARVGTSSVQGYLAPSDDPNDDNFDVWYHDDRPGQHRWTAGASTVLAYSLVSSTTPLPADVAPLGGGPPAEYFLGGGRLVAYHPSNHDPAAGLAPPSTSVRADAESLHRLGFRAVATYASGPALRGICRVFRRAGFSRVFLGVWDPNDRHEVGAAIRQRRCADGYVVGSGGLTRGRYTRADLEAALERVRSRTDRPVTTREPPEAYTRDPRLLTVGDWVFPAVHPYLAGAKEPAAACAWTLERSAGVAASAPAGFATVVGETGFPTAGDAALSEAGQAAFFTCLEASGLRFAFFEGFDQPWKVPLAVEPHWGLLRADGTPKAWAATEAPPAIAITSVPNARTSERPSGRVRGLVANVAPSRFRVVVYARGDRWYTQPLDGSRHAISRRGTWKARTRIGLAFAALLVAPRHVPASPLDALPPVDGIEVFAVDGPTSP